MKSVLHVEPRAQKAIHEFLKMIMILTNEARDIAIDLHSKGLDRSPTPEILDKLAAIALMGEFMEKGEEMARQAINDKEEANNLFVIIKESKNAMKVAGYRMRCNPLEGN